ncbi:MAG: MFS transporter [Chloroflexi bacterium]|nr:MFS transporter [Chloroflexota bacterium]
MFSKRVSALIRPLLASPAGAAFAIRDFRMLWLANSGSSFALNLWFLAMAWLAFELTDSQLWVGILGSAAAIAGISLTLVGGAVADRLDRRGVIVAAFLLFAASALGAGLLDSTGKVSALHLLGFALLIGAVDAFSNPAYRTLVVDLVGNSRLLGANALGQIGEFAGEVVAPLLVGFAIAASGPGAVYFASSGVLVCSAVAVMFVRQRTGRVTGDHTDGRSGIAVEVREGLRYALRTPPFAPLLVISCTSAFGAMVFPLLPAYARDEFKVGAAGFGVMSAAVAAGMVAGAVLMAAVKRMPQGGWSILLWHLLLYSSMAGFAVSRVYPLSIALLFGMGVGSAAASDLVMTALQSRADDRVRGRMMGIFRITESFEPLGAILGGAVAVVAGNSFAVLLGAGLGMGVVLIVFARSRALRAV